jgi:hypothetical protein
MPKGEHSAPLTVQFGDWRSDEANHHNIKEEKMDNVKKAELIGNGVLISFTSGRWQARAKISVNQLGEEIPAEIVSASKSLVDDRTILKDFAMIIRSAKVFINKTLFHFLWKEFVGSQRIG